WKEKVDCLFIDAEEASQEQLRFLRRAKQAISITINAAVPHLLKTGEEVWGQMIKAEGNVEINELYVPPVEDDVLRQPVLFIPTSFGISIWKGFPDHPVTSKNYDMYF